jgi:hypothetical protein
MVILRNVLIARMRTSTGNVRESIRISGVEKWAPVLFVECSNQRMIYFLQDIHRVKQGIVVVVLTKRFGNGCWNTRDGER